MSQFIEMFEGDKYPSVKLSDIASEWLKGQSFRKDDIVDNGNSMCIHYGELFTKYGPIINQVLSRTNVEGKRTSKVGDILFPASDVTPNGLARCSMLPYDNIILGGDIIVLRPKRDCNAAYLSYAINQQTAQLLIRVNGAVVKHMSAKALMTVVIPMPPLEEQNRFVSLAQQADKSKFVGFKSQFIEMFGDINDNSNGIPFDEIFYDDTKSATKISASEYLSSGQYAIYDQSQDTQICGYSNDDDGVNMDYPVILFGDHSRVVKLIDRPFYIGADGVKIIRSKQFDLNIVFAYYMIKYCYIPETGYNRHFKYLKLKRFFAPDREKQNQFVAIAQQADKSKYLN